jgi:hypothetical protein
MASTRRVAVSLISGRTSPELAAHGIGIGSLESGGGGTVGPVE